VSRSGEFQLSAVSNSQPCQQPTPGTHPARVTALSANQPIPGKDDHLRADRSESGPDHLRPTRGRAGMTETRPIYLRRDSRVPCQINRPTAPPLTSAGVTGWQTIKAYVVTQVGP